MVNGFLWGVATSAYQSEGGYNQPGQPQTNWATAEQRGEVDPSGKAAEFWTRHAEDFENCRKMGLSAFRVGIEWSRVQPTFVNAPSEPPDFDLEALDHYADMLRACRESGLEPVITLHHFVHPAWLGSDPWLDPETVAHFAIYVETTVRHINRSLAGRRCQPIRYYITINEPNMLVLNTYLGNQFPSKASRGIGKATAAYNQLLRSHIQAYNVIHDVYGAEGWGIPQVTLNNYCSDLYWSDKLLLDLLSMRERAIAPEGMRTYVCSKRMEFEARLAQAQIPLQRDLPYFFGSLFRRAINWFFHARFDADAFRPFIDSLYQSPRMRVLDYLALDYYDPFSAHTFRSPVWWDHELKNKSFRSWMMNTLTSKWWDWRALPQGLRFFCRYYTDEFCQRPLLIAENGMALRRRMDNSTSHRRDRLTRSEFLRMHVEEVLEILREGIPLVGYLHWSLFDNYEWGTYTPRFGLYSLDYRNGTDRIPVDHCGDCPSLTYATLVKEARLRLDTPRQSEAGLLSLRQHV